LLNALFYTEISQAEVVCFLIVRKKNFKKRLYQAKNNIYPAKTAFTDQYSLPNIFFDIGQL
jgi:hypothetical protein